MFHLVCAKTLPLQIFQMMFRCEYHHECLNQKVLPAEYDLYQLRLSRKPLPCLRQEYRPRRSSIEICQDSGWGWRSHATLSGSGLERCAGMIHYVATFESWGFAKAYARMWVEEIMLDGDAGGYPKRSTLWSVDGDRQKEGLHQRCICYDWVQSLQVN